MIVFKTGVGGGYPPLCAGHGMRGEAQARAPTTLTLRLERARYRPVSSCHRATSSVPSLVAESRSHTAAVWPPTASRDSLDPPRLCPTELR